jgi:hypothetical protein
VQHGGDANATDNAGQTALHWAAVRGAIPVADVLMGKGSARVEAADINGYRVMQNLYCFLMSCPDLLLFVLFFRFCL